MKGIIVVLALGLVVGYCTEVWACPGDGKASAHHIHEGDEALTPYKTFFVENADLSKYKVYELTVEGVMCEDCVMKIETNLKGVKGVVAMEYIWDKKTLRVWGDNVSMDRVVSAIKKAGYRAKPKSA